MTPHAQAHAQPHHRNYVRIWAILVVLLVVSVVGPMAGIRVVTLITAFGIALVKAYMVAKNFMHLDVEKPLVLWVMGATLALMVLLYAGVSPDAQHHQGQNWRKTYVAAPVTPAHEGAESHAGSH
jgi:caa(3)-type oxidase subunit IV